MYNYIKIQLLPTDYTFLLHMWEEGCRYIVPTPTADLPDFLFNLGVLNSQRAAPPNDQYYTIGWEAGMDIRLVTQYGDYYLVIGLA